MERYVINKKIREMLGLSGQELGERVGVTKAAIHHYEGGGGVNKPTLRVIEWELDAAVDELDDGIIKDICHILQKGRA